MTRASDGAAPTGDGAGPASGAPARIVARYERDDVERWLHGMLASLEPLAAADPKLAIIGIRKGGVEIARRLHASLGLATPLGELDIAFYRDDFATLGLHPVVGPSQVPFELADRFVILVDDVLGTGRTVRAAMNEIFDYGRPSRILLAVLVERGDHELPIRADVRGARLEVGTDEYIRFDAASGSVSVTSRKATAAAPPGAA